MNSDSMFQLGNLALSIQGAGGMDNSEAATDADAANNSLGADDGTEGEDFGSSGPPSDLFSEIHGGELKKLEKKIENAENDKVVMAKALGENKSALDKAKADIQSYQANIALLGTYLAALNKLQNDHKKNLETAENMELQASFLELSEKQLAQMQASLKELEATRKGEMPDGLAKLRSEVSFLRKDLVSGEQKIAEFSHDLRILEKLSSDSLRALGDTQLEVTGVQNELSKIYEHVCKTNHQTPSRIMLMRSSSTDKSSSSPSKKDVGGASTTEILLGKLKTPSSKSQLRGLEKIGDAGTIKSNIETVKDQIKYVRDALDKYIEASKTREATEGGTSGQNTDLSGELTEAQENVVKLKSLLSTKREQIATLRTVLKANKTTAEVALSNLKSKYDNEKMVVSETMTKLRNELRLLKEDAATFSSLRAMFAARCEEYATQVDELQRQVGASDDEKKTLNQLLRMAIQQKLVLTQRLEDVEMASEMRNTPKRYARGRGSRVGAPKSGYNFQSGPR